jgi:serine/threonine-protein phosphatase 2B catalytic subunit
MEPLLDPLKDRVVKRLKPPPHRPLAHHLMFPDKPDWIAIRDHLQKEGIIAKDDLIKLIKDAEKLFRNEGNLLYLYDPITIVGDIHGQFYDSLKILEVGGNPENTKYLFLGDFVDRGAFAIEVLILLYALKVQFPKNIFMLRGNHESREMTSFFNFRSECLYKYDQEIYDLFTDSFDALPLVGIINGRFMALHGGISPELETLDNINKLDRFKEPPKIGLFCDLLWADPVDDDTGKCAKIFNANQVRGCSYLFGNAAATKFLKRNDLDSIIRAHEAQLEGYKMHAWGEKGGVPPVITIFSAPNYCDVYKNKGAVIVFKNNALNVKQFKESPHPYTLPNFMDLFTWSIPFVSEKVTEMLYSLVQSGEDEFEEDEDDDNVEVPKIRKLSDDVMASPGVQQRSEIFRNKVKFVSKLIRMNKTLREQNETIVKLKRVSPDNKIPVGLLSQGEDAIKNALEDFKTAREADLINEKRPDTQEIFDP